MLRICSSTNTVFDVIAFKPIFQELIKMLKLCYNFQIKGDIDALDRTKDEEAKIFKGYNIEFDFQIIVRIKETMVDVSSDCMELALKVTPNLNLVWSV